MKYFLDTNIISYIIKGKFPRIIEHLKTIPAQSIVVPSVVKAELEFGARNSQNYERIIIPYMQFLEPFDVKDFDNDASYFYGVIRQELSEDGLLIGPNDLMIAATVLANNGTLVTHNTKEFSRIKDLRVEDWTL
ncbi:MAG: type II toxin-antitoxin system VapC family toxin [Treponemataceae bacterium]|nr:type II toxin-antitoxin system VapC family toxin [Treponemataceae bacterium]